MSNTFIEPIIAVSPSGGLAHPARRTSAKKKAHELAQQLRGERPDYAYLKDVFRYLRVELEVRFPKPRINCLTYPVRPKSNVTTRPCGRLKILVIWC